MQLELGGGCINIIRKACAAYDSSGLDTTNHLAPFQFSHIFHHKIVPKIKIGKKYHSLIHITYNRMAMGAKEIVADFLIFNNVMCVGYAKTLP